MLFKKKSSALKDDLLGHQFIFVEVPEEIAGPEAIRWGLASWWPKNSRIKYSLSTKGILSEQLALDMEVIKKMTFPMATVAQLKITKYVPDAELELTFQTGMLRGHERISIEGRSNGTRIDYELYGKVKGLFPMLFWHLVLKRIHSRQIKIALGSLKNFLQGKYEAWRSRHEEKA